MNCSSCLYSFLEIQLILTSVSLRGRAKNFFPQKSEITVEMGVWVKVSLGIFLVENHPKTALNQYRHFGVAYHMYSACIYIVKSS